MQSLHYEEVVQCAVGLRERRGGGWRHGCYYVCQIMACSAHRVTTVTRASTSCPRGARTAGNSMKEDRGQGRRRLRMCLKAAGGGREDGLAGVWVVAHFVCSRVACACVRVPSLTFAWARCKCQEPRCAPCPLPWPGLPSAGVLRRGTTPLARKTTWLLVLRLVGRTRRQACSSCNGDTRKIFVARTACQQTRGSHFCFP